jgi:hypothetical protein
MGEGIVPPRIIAYGNAGGILSAPVFNFAGMGPARPLFARVVRRRVGLRAPLARVHYFLCAS